MKLGESIFFNMVMNMSGQAQFPFSIICTKVLTKTVSNAGLSLSLPLPDAMSVAKTVTAIAKTVASIAKT